MTGFDEAWLREYKAKRAAMAKPSATTPNPGSDEAGLLGCTCPVIDNARGRGCMGSGEFWVTDGCPVHAPKETKTAPDGQP